MKLFLKKINCEMVGIIKFRALEMTDIQALYEIYSDKEAMKYRGSKPMETIEDAINFVHNREIKDDEIYTIREGIELEGTKELIGSVMYRFNEHRIDECEIGYSIGRKYWGNGYGKKIVWAMIKALKAKDKINKIIAWSIKENIASVKILKGHGFVQISQTENPEACLFVKEYCI